MTKLRQRMLEELQRRNFASEHAFATTSAPFGTSPHISISRLTN